MEILRENFEEELPNILSAIKEADFISYDYEFTGLFTEKDQGVVDTHAERYDRCRRQCVKFLPVQVGICTFKYNHEELKYSYAPYSIYLFPYGSESFHKAPKVYLLQASSIDFLAKHKFDFNKSFHRGVGFGTIEELRNKISEIENRYAQHMEELEKVDEPSMSLPDDKKEFMKEKVELVQKFLKESSDEKDELVFTKLNGFERKLLFTYLPYKLGVDQHAFTVESRYSPEEGPTMVIRRNKEGLEGKKNILIKRKEEHIKNAEMAVGFSKIVEAISQSNAILIGHNQGIDLLHTLHHCVAPVPLSYTEYKSAVKTVFPRLVDTKYLASSDFSDVISCTGLGNLFETTRSHPFKPLTLEPPNDDCDLLSDSSKFHDAAFDAFITGSSFLSMLHSLAEKENISDPVENAAKLVKKFYHRIPVMDCIGVTNMNLGGPDDPITRDTAFIATFPPEWKTSHLRDAFKPAISDFNRISIHWQNDTTAWIRLSDKLSPSVVEALSDPQSGFRVTSFANHLKEKETDAEPTAKRMKVENGSEQKNVTVRTSTGHTPSVFEVPKDW